MYTTIIHPLRKALNLSIQEYVLLDMVYHLSNNEKYGGWCVMSKTKMAEILDLSRATIYRGIKTLEERGLVKRDKETKYVKTTDEYNELIANKEDWIIGFKGKESSFLSGKTTTEYQIDTPSIKSLHKESQIETPGSLKLRHNIYKDNNNIYFRQNEKKIYNGNVLLSDAEYEELRAKFGSDLDDEIENLSLYMKSKNVTFASHYYTILSWAKKKNMGKKEKGDYGDWI